ncbi:hypothetical protein V6N11_014113 [Hibiscus sabdariffa]|uniref:Small ribosomal subunit protein uS14m n=2 Tax=Hibiscus sabdariffa TaxID=183260 RepID=A0ABR2AFN0_9ROSI
MRGKLSKMSEKRNIRDHKRRLLAAKYELRRKLYKAFCKDPDLPSDMRDKHRYKLSKLPRNSSFARGSWRKLDPGWFPNPTDRNLRATLNSVRRSKTSSFPQLVPQTPTTRKAETDSNQSTTIHERIPSSYRPTRYAGSPLPLISQVGNGSGWLATTSRNEEVFHVGFNTKARQQATNNHLSDSPVTAGLRPRTRRKGTP